MKDVPSTAEQTATTRQQLFDGKIEKIEAEQEANNAALEQEQTNVDELVAKKVITEEEGEARKRAAAAKTAKQNEELEKKKQALKIKQAKWDKANSIVQATISTALAVMNALQTQPFWLGLAMAAVAGAMGAVQIATIMAQPIPAYAKGTDRHIGGPALVGDGGQSEVVMYGGKAFLTPDTPTLVDIPAGAVVLPSVNDFTSEQSLLPLPKSGQTNVVVNNNYKDLQREVAGVANLIKKQTYQQHVDSYLRAYDIFKSSRI